MRAEKTDSLTESQKTAVLEQLARVLESDFFRGSQRCCHFLQYSVQYVLNGRPQNDLKERIIGMEVFHKSGDYDTAQDNIVRVTANEVRKRLAQYYGDEHRTENPTFHLQSGTYAVSLRWKQDDSALPTSASGPVVLDTPPSLENPVKDAPHSKRHWQIIAAIIFVLIAASTLIAYRSLHKADLISQVWGPILDSPKPVVVSISQPVAYRPSSNMDMPLGPNDRMVPMPDAFVGTGDAFALADVAKVLSLRGKEWQLQAGNSTPSQTLLAGPMILIGVHANQWTRPVMENLRFFFGINNAIYDRSNPNVKWSLEHLSPDWKTDEDFALVSRFLNPGSGQPVIVIAGLTNFGTEAAGDFLTDQSLLLEALQKAPKDWQSKNFQFVLHTRIIGNTPERPTVVAATFW